MKDILLPAFRAQSVKDLVPLFVEVGSHASYFDCGCTCNGIHCQRITSLRLHLHYAVVLVEAWAILLAARACMLMRGDTATMLACATMYWFISFSRNPQCLGEADGVLIVPL
jgi:hypothetical protein